MFKGFTYIEMIVVMSIIGLLAAIGINQYPGVSRTGRDTQRKNDLRQYQTSLEGYANTHGNFYPSQTATVDASVTLCANLGLSNCPDEPKGVNHYFYQSNGSGGGISDAIQYVLWTQLEQPPSPTTYWVICSIGRAGSATSGIPPSSGACPI